MIRIATVLLSLTLVILLNGCAGKRMAMVDKPKATPGQELIQSQEAGWLRYEFYRQQPKTRTEDFVLAIRIVNKESNESPLRRVSASLDHYNRYYDYLLNYAKEDIVLKVGGQIYYPKRFAFENSYNAFPFETINLTYTNLPHGWAKSHPVICFSDRVFSHQEVVCSINLGHGNRKIQTP